MLTTKSKLPKNYTIVTRGTKAARLTGHAPYVRGHVLKGWGQDYALLERKSDNKLFLELGPYASRIEAEKWAKALIRTLDRKGVL